jgi:hypothetical protein
VSVEPEPEQVRFGSDAAMVRLFVGVGRNHRVGPADIVGAVANEGDIPGKAIGAIDVYDHFTLVDIPAEYAKQVLLGMRETKIRNQRAGIRVAAPNDVAENNERRRQPERERAPRSRANSDPRDRKAGPKKFVIKGGAKPPKRKKSE